jgi:hypothetical protein
MGIHKDCMKPSAPINTVAVAKSFIIIVMKKFLLFPLLIIFLLLGGCVPQLEDSGPSVALINAPAEGRITGLADKLEARLLNDGALGYAFTSSSKIRFAETHRDMGGGRAPLQAAFIARTYGAELALMIGSPSYKREVFEFTLFKTPKRKIITQVQLEVVIIDPVTAEPRSTYSSQLYTAVRVETIDGDLIEEQADPDLTSLIDKALDDIVPVVRQDLNTLFANLASR